ncbi:MAG: hypothetical protein AAFY91_13180 [Bacteroidota bacterium]
MPVPTKIELLSILRDGRLDLAIKKLNEATDEYVVEYGLASIRDGYTELVLIGGRLQELIHMLHKKVISEDNAMVERALIKESFIATLDELPNHFWINEPPPSAEETKPPPIPKVNRPQITEIGADTSPSKPESDAGSLYTPATYLPEKVKPILVKYRDKLFLAELDFAPLDFERSFSFLNKYLPSLPKETIVAAFSEKYFWKLSGIVLTDRYIFMKDTFDGGIFQIDYRSVESVALQKVFPWSITINGQAYALGGFTDEQRELLRSFVEEVVLALR